MSIFIETGIDNQDQASINKQFDDNFGLLKNMLQSPYKVKQLPPNEHNVSFVDIGVIMFTEVDVDYDNPNIKDCKDLVFHDFAHKILTLFKENPFGMRKNAPHCWIYEYIYKRWFVTNRVHGVCKKIMSIYNYNENLAEFIQTYIADYTKHSYIGKDVIIPSVEDVINWCGGKEFPLIDVYLINSSLRNSTSIAYTISR